MNGKEKEVKYIFSCPITIEISGIEGEDYEEAYERAYRLFQFKVTNGEFNYNKDDIDMEKIITPPKSKAEIELEDKMWNAFISRDFDTMERLEKEQKQGE